MSHFPIFADLTNRPVLLVGAGHIAERKAEALFKAGAHVLLVASELSQRFQTWLQDNKEAEHDTPTGSSSTRPSHGKLSYLGKQFSDTQLQSVFLVISATDDHELNAQVFAAAERLGKFCNSVDNPARCSFMVPAIVDRSPLQVAVSSAGTAPVLARLVRQRIETLLPQHLGKTAALAGRWRQTVKNKLPLLTERRRFWENFFSSSADNHVARGNTHAAEQALQKQLQQHKPLKQGEAILVGAGPGDPGLLTLRALQAIQAADVVLYDALISPEVLELVRRDAQKIYVGKVGYAHQFKQAEINRLLIDFCKDGKRVVRLKGGDPFVFGRGAEECHELVKEGINYSLVPGITAGLGATAYAGIPLTHRDYAQTAIFITGHVQPGSDELQWQSLARGKQTLVIYMGAIKAAFISSELIKYGRSPNTPAAVISHGTLASQLVRTGTLSDLADLVVNAPSPTLIVIGEVVKLREQLAWFQKDSAASDQSAKNIQTTEHVQQAELYYDVESAA